jgi:hypothetical protein
LCDGSDKLRSNKEDMIVFLVSKSSFTRDVRGILNVPYRDSLVVSSPSFRSEGDFEEF